MGKVGGGVIWLQQSPLDGMAGGPKDASSLAAVASNSCSLLDFSASEYHVQSFTHHVHVHVSTGIVLL